MHDIENVYILEMVKHYRDLKELFPNSNFGGTLNIDTKGFWVRLTSRYQGELFNLFKSLLGDDFIKDTSLHITYKDDEQKLVLGYKCIRKKDEETRNTDSR